MREVSTTYGQREKHKQPGLVCCRLIIPGQTWMKFNAQNSQHRNILWGDDSREGNSTERGKVSGDSVKRNKADPRHRPKPQGDAGGHSPCAETFLGAL